MFNIYVDSSKRKAGPTAIGVVVEHAGEVISEIADELPWNLTNNEAEYRAIIRGIQVAIGANKDANIYSDSKVAVEQINGRWKINYPRLQNLRDIAVKKLADSDLNIQVIFIPREQNKLANQISQNLTKKLLGGSIKKAYIGGQLESVSG